jgi:hypothetical protein
MTAPTSSGPAPWAPPEASAVAPPGSADGGAATAGGPATAPGPAAAAAAAGIARARGDTRARSRPADHDLDDNPLRHLDVGGPGVVLDEAVAMLRFRFRRLVALAATVVLPVQLLSLVISLRSGISADSVDDVLPSASVLVAAGATWPEQMLVLSLQAVALALTGMAAGHLAAAWLEERDPTYRETAAAVASRAWVAPVVVLGGLMVKVPFLLLGGVGYVLGDALVFTAAAVAGAERLGPLRAVARSIRLARGDYGLAVVVALGGLVLTQVLQFALVLGPVVLVSTFAPPEGWVVALGHVGSLVVLVTAPLTACVAARTWVELRCRVEGLDLRRRAASLGLSVDP